VLFVNKENNTSISIKEVDPVNYAITSSMQNILSLKCVKVVWRPLPEDWLKWNVDGSVVLIGSVVSS